MREPRIVEDLIHIVQTGSDRVDTGETVKRRLDQWYAAKIARREERRSAKPKTRHLLFEISERLERHLYYQGDPPSEWIPRIVHRMEQIEKDLGLPRPGQALPLPKSGTIRVEETPGWPAEESFFHGLPEDRAHSADQYSAWMDAAQQKWRELTSATTVASLDEPGTARTIASKFDEDLENREVDGDVPVTVARSMIRQAALDAAREIGNRVRAKMRELEHR